MLQIMFRYSFIPCPDAKVSIWYRENKPNMKEAVKKLKRAFPSAETHTFAGYGIRVPVQPAARIRQTTDFSQKPA